MRHAAAVLSEASIVLCRAVCVSVCLFAQKVKKLRSEID